MLNNLLFFLFIFGLFIGSFLNMLIDRLPRGEQILTGRSHCDNCGKDLKWFDMFPVVSWFILRGKCRFCHSPIPFRNTLVEIITGSVFVITANGLPFILQGELVTGYGLDGSGFSQISLIRIICELLIFSSLIAIFFIDLDQRIIPDELVIVGVIGSIGLLVIRLMGQISLIGSLEGFLFSGIGAAMFFLLLVLVTRGRGMGMGDVKLAFLMGLFLGWPNIIPALYVAFLTGAIIGVILILGGKKQFGQQIAFGPFLVFSTFVAYYFSEPLIRLFLPFIGG